MGIETKNKSDFRPSAMKIFVLKLTNLVYRHLFHEEMSADVLIFLKNLFGVSVATAISTLFIIIFTILGGRKLGPEEYGKFVLIQSVSTFINIPMQLGFATAMLKYTSEKDDFKRQSDIIITTYTLVVLLTVFFIIIYIVFTPWLSNLFSISPELFHFAIAFAGLSVFYSLTTSAIRGLNMMKAYSIFQVVYGSLMLLSFLIFIIGKQFTFEAMVYPMFITYIICTLAILVLYMRKFWEWNFQPSLVKLIIKFASFSTISGVSFVLYTNIDKIMISRYLNINDVGIYNAYYTASIVAASAIFNMFIMVFFPTISKYEHKSIIFARINKFIPYLLFLGIPFMAICEFIVMKLYGNQYPFDWIWIALASIASIGFIIEGLYIWLLNSVGTSGAKIAALGAVIILVVNIGLNILLIPMIEINGALLSIIASLMIGTIVILYCGRKYLNS